MANLSIISKPFYDSCPHCQEPLFLFQNDEKFKQKNWRCKKEKHCPLSFRRIHFAGADNEFYSFIRLNFKIRIFPQRKKDGIWLFPINNNKTKVWPETRVPFINIDFSNLETLDNKIKFWLTFQ